MKEHHNLFRDLNLFDILSKLSQIFKSILQLTLPFEILFKSFFFKIYFYFKQLFFLWELIDPLISFYFYFSILTIYLLDLIIYFFPSSIPILKDYVLHPNCSSFLFYFTFSSFPL